MGYTHIENKLLDVAFDNKKKDGDKLHSICNSMKLHSENKNYIFTKCQIGLGKQWQLMSLFGMYWLTPAQVGS